MPVQFARFCASLSCGTAPSPCPLPHFVGARGVLVQRFLCPRARARESIAATWDCDFRKLAASGVCTLSVMPPPSAAFGAMAPDAPGTNSSGPCSPTRVGACRHRPVRRGARTADGRSALATEVSAFSIGLTMNCVVEMRSKAGEDRSDEAVHRRLAGDHGARDRVLHRGEAARHRGLDGARRALHRPADEGGERRSRRGEGLVDRRSLFGHGLNPEIAASGVRRRRARAAGRQAAARSARAIRGATGARSPAAKDEAGETQAQPVAPAKGTLSAPRATASLLERAGF